MRSEGNDHKNGEPNLYSPSRQCSSTPVGFGQGFVSKEQCDNTGAPPYFPDLTPGDFYLFHRIESALKGQSFYDVTAIIKHAMDELKRLSQNGFQQCFQHLCSCWNKCIFAQGSYFEENVA
jgi:hypothetical protein